MRYVKQPDNYSCGPIAIINILKWLGQPASLVDLPKIKKICKTKYDGTNDIYFSCGLRKKTRGLAYISKGRYIKILDRHLNNGGAAVIGYLYRIGNKTHGHFVTCVKRTKNGNYVLINEADHRCERQDRRPTRVRRTRKELIKMLHTRDELGYSGDVWLVSKIT